MASFGETLFLDCLKKPVAERTQQDVDIIYAYLHGLESLSNLREAALRAICKTVRYEFHDANDILYCRGELSSCWYILLAGSVFIDGSMFLPRSSFGKRSAGCKRRPNECLILEPSEMIVIDYPDVQIMRPGSRVRNQSSGMNNIEKILSLDTEDSRMGRGRYHSDSSTEQFPPELQSVHNVLQQHHRALRGTDPGGGGCPPGGPGTHPGSSALVKRGSRASDTSSAYSGSDMMQSSLGDDDDDRADMMSGLAETLVDSDDEEGYVESPDSLIVRDTVRECLEKDPTDRTEDDIEILLEFLQHLPAFANMTLATRRSLCAVMVFAVVEKAGMIVMNDGEELDSWSVILNGHVEITRPDGTIEHLHMGDSFGITPTTEKLYHKGVMRTKIDDCQFVCIAQQDYYNILHQGEENTRRIEENGQTVLVTEHRVLDSGNRKGHIVIRGTPDKLMSHLVDEHSSVDPTYVEDFLLTYRTFLKSPLEVADRLLDWFNDPKHRDRVTRVILLWVNNHFNDFETEPVMSEFLEKFEQSMENERMHGQLRLLNIACAAKARPRTVVLTRATRDEILHFSVLGGLERGCGIFISKVEKNSKAHEAGLKRGDQILEVNNQNFEHISHNKALEILRKTTHLSVTVKSNLLAFKEMLVTGDESPSRAPKKKEHIAKLQQDPRQRLSSSDLDSSSACSTYQPVIAKDGKKDGKQSMSTGHKAKIRKALMKFNIMPSRNVNRFIMNLRKQKPLTRSVSYDPQLNMDDSSSDCSRGHARKPSSSSNNSSPMHTPHLSASNPDLTSISGYSDDGRTDFPEHVLRIYKSDQTCKYILLHRETTAREVVMLVLREFGINDPSSNFSLCEVSVQDQGFVKTKRLPDQMTGLPDKISLNARYYIRNNMSTDTLVPDEMTGELLKDSQISFLSLNSSEIAAQLTLQDFHLFHEVEPTEYIDDLYELDSKYGTPHLATFSQLVNKEMFWVVTEVCNEINVVKRSKIIKHFIKIARHCKECKNFNSMFAIVSGLGHGSVSRLRLSWDKVPTKYIKLFEDLQDLMDPSRNMSKYRNLVNSELVSPPMIPFFPVVKKDLTFIHLGNDSKVETLVNFEKLRMIAKEVRHTCNMASAQYDDFHGKRKELANMLLGGVGTSQSVFSAFSGLNASTVATMRRKRRSSTIPNPKKMYEEAQMVRRVKSYLNNMNVIEDEPKLNEMSMQCEPVPASGSRKRDPSPSPAALNGSIDGKNLGPKFDASRQTAPTKPRLGADEPDAVRKLMSLSEKVRPHNSKLHPLPAHRVLKPSPRLQQRPPVSPRGTNRTHHQAAVLLSPESSSVVSLGNIALRKSNTTNSVGSNESSSPTNSVGSYAQPFDTDSGHNSVTSSSYDSHSTSSVGSTSSPPPVKKPHANGAAHGAGVTALHHHQMALMAQGCTNNHHQGGTHSSSRPPLPPYHMVVNSSTYNNYIQQQYMSSRSVSNHAHTAHTTAQTSAQPPAQTRGRPQLPDYRSATQMAHLARRKHVGHHGRSHSCEGVLGVGGGVVQGGAPGFYRSVSGVYNEQPDPDDEEDSDTEEEEEDDDEEQVSAV